MADPIQIFKALDAFTEQDGKWRRQLTYNPWAKYDKVRGQTEAPARVAAAVMGARPVPLSPAVPKPIRPTLPAFKGTSGVLDPEVTSRALRPYTQSETGIVKAAEMLRGHPALAPYSASNSGIAKAAEALRGSPTFRSLVDQEAPLSKVTKAIGQHPGLNAFAQMLQDGSPLAKAMVSAAERAGAGKQCADMATVGRSFPHGPAAAPYQHQAGSPTFSPLQALTRIVEREAPEFGQAAAAAIRNSSWAKTLEAPASPTNPIVRALTKRPAFMDIAGLIEPVSVQGPVVPIAETQAAPAEVEIAGEIVELSPQSLAEVSAGADARFNKQAAESLLVDEGLDHELSHLDYIPELLLRSDEAAREYAALAASKIIKGLADRFRPGRKGEVWIARWDDEQREVGPGQTANRLAAYLDTHLRAHLESHEHRQLEATLFFVTYWAGHGHHVAHTPAQAGRAYRDFLMVLAYVARARQIESGR
jgi:hypothetical protein